MLTALLVLPAPATAALPPLVVQSVHFEVPGQNLIPGVAAFRASCDVNASGEPLSLLDNQTIRTTISAAPGACSMILILFGVEVGIPTITTTPIGRSSYYIPGLSLGTLGLGDVSLDLQSSLNSTSRVADSGAASLDAEAVNWSSWGAHRLMVQGAHGSGNRIISAINTTFTYSLDLGLTVWIAGIQVYQAGLAAFGAYQGTPALLTPLSVDLLPHRLTLGPAHDVSDHAATLNWTGTIDSDMDHLELWVDGGGLNVSYRITDRVTSAMTVPLKANTDYRSWIVVVDESGQAVASPVVSYRTLTAPVSPPSTTPTPPPTYTEAQANLIVIGTFAFIAVLAALVAYGFGRTRGRV